MRRHPAPKGRGAAAELALEGPAESDIRGVAHFEGNPGDRHPVTLQKRVGAAYGDRDKRAHGSFGRFPPTFETPTHVHTGAYHGVVIKGVMTNPFGAEQNSPSMEPGSPDVELVVALPQLI